MDWHSPPPCLPTPRPARLDRSLSPHSRFNHPPLFPSLLPSLYKTRRGPHLTLLLTNTPHTGIVQRQKTPAITGTRNTPTSAPEMDNLEATELRLGLPGTNPPAANAASWKGNKRSLSDEEEETKRCSSKAQVVGWPPVRSYKRKGKRSEAVSGGVLVKVSMDGAPYLRKIDLNIYMGYKELREALEDMFRGFSLSLECEISEVEACYGSDQYAIAYEDKDGDWMLAGDVPWEMFISSCRRLRMMKGSEARGLASS